MVLNFHRLNELCFINFIGFTNCFVSGYNLTNLEIGTKYEFEVRVDSFGRVGEPERISFVSSETFHQSFLFQRFFLKHSRLIPITVSISPIELISETKLDLI